MNTFMNAVREMRLAQRAVRVPARDDPMAKHAKKLEHRVDGLMARCEIEFWKNEGKSSMEERNDE